MNENLAKVFDGEATTTRSLIGSDSAPREFLSQALFKGSREVLIAHGDREYRLRITANGKLLFTA